MGEITVLNKATTKSKSLRTTIPIDIVKQFNLSEGYKLNWEDKAEDGRFIIVVEPLRREKMIRIERSSDHVTSYNIAKIKIVKGYI